MTTTSMTQTTPATSSRVPQLAWRTRLRAWAVRGWFTKRWASPAETKGRLKTRATTKGTSSHQPKRAKRR